MGRLEYRGVEKGTDRPIFEQKRVDIMISIDMLLMSYSQQVSDIVLLSGDSDFIPCIEIVKQQGKLTTLWYAREDIIRAHNELIKIFDEKKIIDQNLLNSCLL